MMYEIADVERLRQMKFKVIKLEKEVKILRVIGIIFFLGILSLLMII